MRACTPFAIVLLCACAAPTPAASAPAPQTAAAAQPASAYVELTNPADGTRIALQRGGELKLIFDAQPAYNLQWESEAAPGPVLSPIGQRIFVGKSTNPIDYKAGAWNVFRYRAEQAGRVTLKFDLRPFGETGPAVKTLQYDVAVE